MSDLKQLLIYISDVQQISAPLLKHTPVAIFNYSRYYKNGSVFSLTSDERNVQWFNYYINKCELLTNAANIITHVRNGMAILSISGPQILDHARNFINVTDGLTIIEEHDAYYEICNFFASAGHDESLDFYINNIDILKKFSLYFREKATSIIAKGDKETNRFRIPKLSANLNMLPNNTSTRDKILNSIKIDNFHLQDNSHSIHITRRELESLLLLLKGRGYKEIGHIMHISPRTVEVHIDHVKEKLHCRTRSMLFDKAYALGLFKLLVD